MDEEALKNIAQEERFLYADSNNNIRLYQADGSAGTVITTGSGSSTTFEDTANDDLTLGVDFEEDADGNVIATVDATELLATGMFPWNMFMAGEMTTGTFTDSSSNDYNEWTVTPGGFTDAIVAYYRIDNATWYTADESGGSLTNVTRLIGFSGKLRRLYGLHNRNS